MMAILWTQLLLIFLLTTFGIVSAEHYDIASAVNSSLPSEILQPYGLFDRALPAGQCADGSPCADGSCCDGNSGYCGLDAAHCTIPPCISNCDAKAECGGWAPTTGTTCPLNVCCDQYGYCGVTPDFCSTGCQSNCEQPPATTLSNGNVLNLVIGYFSAWAPLQRGCNQRDVSFIRTDSITHLYVAFGYITPDTYDIFPIPGSDMSTILQIMQLKQNAPGLRIYLSLGGWSFSDNGTAGQPVFGDLSSTPAKRSTFITNLSSFMRQYGFDGVDIDWEYPGAPDRGGSTADTANYVALLRDIRTWWDAQTSGWGLSFTAPTSYWYLRWFDIGNMTQYADWVNLMTYDLHGSWDSPEDDIGSFVYAHTNLTEISAALDLLWRNNIPANKVNLGLGFYGRSYTLSDPSCTSPGCPFSGPGIAGDCTGTPGILSYDEIETTLSLYQLTTVYDETAGVNYFSWNQNQWVSFDDTRSLEQKVDYANQNGLLGIFIWALDLDDMNHDALNAVLNSKGGLGAFKEQNGVGLNDFTNYTQGQGACFLGACSPTPGCTGPYQAVGHQIRCDQQGMYRQVCCPNTNTPDPAICTWRGADIIPLICAEGCMTDEVLIVKSDWYYVPNTKGSGDAACFFGTEASYCCKTSETAQQACGPVIGSCITILTNGLPADPDTACPTGKKFVTFSADVGGCTNGGWMPWCCNEEYPASCNWAGCKDPTHCPQNTVPMGTSFEGGGNECTTTTETFTSGLGFTINTVNVDSQLCCEAGSLTVYSQTLPAPLDWIFPTPGPSTDKQSFDLEVGPNPGSGSSQDPDADGFGWAIMSGPQSELSTFDKRDGSHWELYDCPTEKHEGRQTVKAVCTDTSADSNCGDIYLGRGVAETIIELPEECGAGHYAMAVSLELAVNKTLPSDLRYRLMSRGVSSPKVYDFTFDFDFSPLQRRGDSNVLVRIDYSSVGGYWRKIVDASPDTTPMRKREIITEVDTVHGGSWKRYLHHTFKEERRRTPDHKLDILHKRWFSSNLADWLTGQYDIDEEWELARLTYKDTFIYYLFNEQLKCTFQGFPVNAYFAAWSQLGIDVETSATLSLIGNMGNLNDWNESHVTFRNKGSIDVELGFEAFGQIQFSTGTAEVFGTQNFGSAFNIPGLVTIGPTFRIGMELTGQMSVHTKATVNFNVASWDYTQRYPNTNNDIASGVPEEGEVPETSSGNSATSFYADLSASGDITAWVKPLIQLGIVFNPNLGVPSASIDLELDAYATLYGSAGVGTTQNANVCYGANAGIELFAAVNAPTLFGASLNQKYSFVKRDFNLIQQQCFSPESFQDTTCDACAAGPTS